MTQGNHAVGSVIVCNHTTTRHNRIVTPANSTVSQYNAIAMPHIGIVRPANSIVTQHSSIAAQHNGMIMLCKALAIDHIGIVERAIADYTAVN